MLFGRRSETARLCIFSRWFFAIITNILLLGIDSPVDKEERYQSFARWCCLTSQRKQCVCIRPVLKTHVQSMSAAGLKSRCFSVTAVSDVLSLRIRTTSLFKIRNGAHQISVALCFFLLWHATFVFYLVFSLFLNEMLVQWQEEYSVSCALSCLGILLLKFCVYAGWASDLVHACISGTLEQQLE